ncbi:MAG: acyltransferase [Pseudobdellovibrionaceae bacterium]|jgi:putative oxidoreductase
MKQKITLGARILLGLIFVVFGLNGFLQFLPMPPMAEEAGKAIAGLFGVSYMFPVVKGLEIIAGIALLAGLFVPLALIVLAPIVVNIFLFHVVYTPAESAMAIAILVLQILAAAGVWEKFKSVLEMK